MKYMVMECHLSYAVVLDEEGGFLKVANRHYEVGQTVGDVFPMQIPQHSVEKKKSNRWLYTLTAMAACLMLMVTSVFQLTQMRYASVYMRINPEVRIDVNRRDVVVGVEGVNPDGDDLLAGYEYRKKDLSLVMDELLDRAIDMGYLHEGGQITLVLDAESDEWVIVHSDTLTTQLNEHLKEKLSVTIEVTDKNEQSAQVIIPVAPAESNYGDSDYGDAVHPDESDYGDSGYGEGQSDYGGSDYSDYAQSDYGGFSDYGTDDSNSDYTSSGWGQSDYDDGQSDHGSAVIEAQGNSDYGDAHQSDYSSYDAGSYDSYSDYGGNGQSGYDGSDYDDD